jgi:hypothetical protein
MELVQINFDIIGKAFEKHVRQKAILAGNTIVYAINGQLIEEDPITLKKTVLKSVSYSK